MDDEYGFIAGIFLGFLFASLLFVLLMSFDMTAGGHCEGLGEAYDISTTWNSEEEECFVLVDNTYQPLSELMTFIGE